MTTIILGAGIAGITNAYYLAREGREVVVVDRQSQVASETSYANAGLLAPGHTYTWASPKAPKILLRSLYKEGQALRLKKILDPQLWGWGIQFLRHCTWERARENTTRKVHLCFYAMQQMAELTEQERLGYDRADTGGLYLYRDPAAFEAGVRATSVLTDNGVSLRSITADEVIELEPALRSARDQIAGGIYSSMDASGDCHRFSVELRERCERLGVRFEMDRTVSGFVHTADRVQAVITDKGELRGDEFVLALGSYTPLLARKLGYRLPVYPVKGYSLTLPIRDGDEPPSIGGVDENNLVAWSRLGDRFRLTATAEFAGYSTTHEPSDFQHMLNIGRNLFPRAADFSKPGYWSCLRPMTPDGTPILGATRHRNLYLNTGHGHIGWTFACGTSRIVTDIMKGKKPELGMEGLALR